MLCRSFDPSALKVGIPMALGDSLLSIRSPKKSVFCTHDKKPEKMGVFDRTLCGRFDPSALKVAIPHGHMAPGDCLLSMRRASLLEARVAFGGPLLEKQPLCPERPPLLAFERARNGGRLGQKGTFRESAAKNGPRRPQMHAYARRSEPLMSTKRADAGRLEPLMSSNTR